VFESTYTEFQLQVQLYNQEKKHSTFAEILANTPAAEKLHFLVSAAIMGYLQQLKGNIPDILNNTGKQFLRFDHYRFEIINSDIKNKKNHQVAISFYSESLLWHDTIGDYLLVSPVNAESKDEILTDLVYLQPFLSIYSLKTTVE
jgi:hypothetical protein